MNTGDGCLDVGGLIMPVLPAHLRSVPDRQRNNTAEKRTSSELYLSEEVLLNHNGKSGLL